jgi:hypothetical protein
MNGREALLDFLPIPPEAEKPGVTSAPTSVKWERANVDIVG